MSEKDNTELKPAEENPWYVLATLHGENPDKNTLSVNKDLWNKFFKHKLEGQPLARRNIRTFLTVAFPISSYLTPRRGLIFQTLILKIR
jgi:hypothetical protein